MTPTECLLKSQNYSAAARLDPKNPRAAFWLDLAEVWRLRALEVYRSGEYVDLCFRMRTETVRIPEASPQEPHPAARSGAHSPLHATGLSLSR